MSSDGEDQKLLSNQSPKAMTFAARWSISDWFCTLLLTAFGLWLDRAPPFMRYLPPQES